MASCWASTSIVEPSHIIFFSDSQAAILAIDKTRTGSKMVLDIIDHLNHLGTTHRVEVRWVPGHEGVPGNERADELARAGSATQPAGPEPFLPLTDRVIQNEIFSLMYKLHIKQYRNLDLSPKGKVPLTIFLQKFRYKTLSMTAEHRRWLTWLLSGHSPLAYFQHKANNNKFDSPDCEHCPGLQETSEHFLGECVAYMTLRLRTFGKIILSIEEIAQTPVKKIIEFVQNSHRFDREDLFG